MVNTTQPGFLISSHSITQLKRPAFTSLLVQGPYVQSLLQASRSFIDYVSTSTLNQVAVDSRGGSSASRASSEPELQIIWLQQIIMLPTLVPLLQKHKSRMAVQSFSFSRRTSIRRQFRTSREASRIRCILHM